MDKSEELAPFLKIARTCLGANGSKAVPYYEFLRAYKKDSNNMRFEEEARNAGYANGREALANYPTIFEVNGDNVRRVDMKDIKHITSAVDQSQSRAMRKKKSRYQPVFGFSRPVVHRNSSFLSRMTGPMYNQRSTGNYDSTMGPPKPFIPMPSQYFTLPVPIQIPIIQPRVKTPLEIRPAPPKFNEPKQPVKQVQVPAKVIEPMRQIQSVHSLPAKVIPIQQIGSVQKGGSIYSLPITVIESALPIQGIHLFPVNFIEPKRSFDIQVIHSLAASITGSKNSIKKDDVLVFKSKLDVAIKSVAEKLTNLFNEVLNYGDDNILSVELIKEFIEKHGFKNRMSVKHFSMLVTMFTEWEAESDGVRVVFKHSGKLEVPPLIDSCNSKMAIPSNAIEDGFVKTGKIIGTTKNSELIIRLTEWTEKYAELKHKLSNYYDMFDETSTSYLAHHVSNLFVDDLVLYWDLGNGRFLRCVVTGVEESGDVVIYSIDEGLTERISPSTLFPIPYKFRKYEPLCLVFETCAEDMTKIGETEKQVYLMTAKVIKDVEVECIFEFLGRERRNSLADLFFGTWDYIHN